jgi:hypothetical protein
MTVKCVRCGDMITLIVFGLKMEQETRADEDGTNTFVFLTWG